ncbi:MAG: LPS-assembly protein LptD [Ignavibacteriales bacterium]|nr:LPS-assembly protein LptD [Ignavibacteriales bacterium]
MPFVVYSQNKDSLSLSAPLSVVRKDTSSLPADTLSSKNDSIQTSRSGVDTLVVYTAKDSIVYSMRTRFMNLYGKSELNYRRMGLKAERVNVNWDNATLFAEGIKDTADKAGKKIVGSPIMSDAGEDYKGSHIGYNFRTQKGKINLGNTEIEQGYYYGEAIKKIDKDILFVENGRYTTCDAEHPHYYFFSPKMKVIVRDHIVAEPIYFYVADVPLFALPFGAFPNKAGRRSGIIAPAYGEDFRKGQFLSHIGYYWAISDYMDASTAFDLYTRGGWVNRSLFRYGLRYDFTGSVSMNVTSLHDGEPSDPARTEQRDYNINISHNQTINPTTRLDVNFTFATGSYFHNVSSNLNEILRQNIVSNATLSKTWEEGNRSLTMSAYRDQNLVTGNVEERIPSISFSQGQFFPFRRQTPKLRGLSSEGDSELHWYEMIGVTYSGDARSNRSKRNEVIKSIVNPLQDSTTITTIQERYGVKHNVQISASPKAGYFNISPSVSYQELWYTKSIEQDSNGTRDVKGLRAVRTFSTGVSASTRFFGIFQPQVFGITGIRQTVTPSLSFNYTPDFSDPKYGYYGTYIDKGGRTVKYSFFEREIYGGAQAGLQENLSLSIGSLFEMKYKSTDTSQQEQKIQLLNIGGGVSYNFAADSLKLSPLSLSYRTDIGRYLSISAGTTHDFYVFDPVAKTRVNRFLFSDRKKLADLTSVSFNLSTTLSGEKKAPTGNASTPQHVQAEQDRVSGQVGPPAQQQTYQGLFEEQTPDFNIPWNLALSYSFSQTQYNPEQKFVSSSLNATISFNLTDKWRFSTSGSYDFTRKEFAAPSVNIYRDLHCWEMNVTWFPMGFYRGYRFELRIKAPQLQDIKITKQGSERGTYY